MRAMKDSGVPWIGEIPEGWKVCKTKDVFVRKNEKAHQENPIVLSLTRAGVKVRDITKNEGQLAESYSDYNPVEPFDLLLNPMDLYSGANCSISLVRGVISPAYVNLKAKANACPRFYDYYYKTQYWSMAFFAHGKGISFDNRWTLGMDTLFRYNVPLPPLAEQQKIAEFLDRKCAEVDEMIALQEQIIEELKAYKQSVITEAVTKGLNPAAPMRDSGIEWIGSIPEHWEVKRLKDVGYLYGGLTGKAGDDFIAEDDETCQYMRFIPYTNIFNNYLINPAQLYKVCIEEGEKQNLVNKGDILFLMSSEDYDGVGKPAMIDVQVDNLGLNSFCKGFRITDNGTYPKYLLYLLLSHTLREMVRQDGKGFIRINLRQDKLSTCPIILPDIVEQQAIADYLDEKCADIDSLIQTKQSKIDSLKEYKKSIIYEYVTGKREVE